jgi:hypothetical protein
MTTIVASTDQDQPKKPEGKTNVNVVTMNANAISAHIERDPYAELAASLTSPGMRGKPIKFVKGRWLSGRGNDEQDVGGKQLVADLVGLMTGWRRWWDRKVTDQVVGLIADKFRPPQRNDLGDLDEAAWERDSTGKPTDPWQFGFFLRFVDPENDEEFAWSATSDGARQEIGNLVAAFVKRRKKHPAECVPIVRLASDFYRHKTHGRVDTPMLEIIGWRASASPPSLPAPDGSDDKEMDDDIPF